MKLKKTPGVEEFLTGWHKNFKYLLAPKLFEDYNESFILYFLLLIYEV